MEPERKTREDEIVNDFKQRLRKSRPLAGVGAVMCFVVCINIFPQLLILSPIRTTRFPVCFFGSLIIISLWLILRKRLRCPSCEKVIGLFMLIKLITGNGNCPKCGVKLF